MNLEAALEQARRGRLYPSVILDGGKDAEREAAAVTLARALLCENEDRPCGSCSHCRRITWPGKGEDAAFHPDFAVLLRDLKASTSVGATKEFLKGAQVAPFEARGQVFVIASAESLTPEAANSLLKLLEEPPDSAPRNFLLLAPSRLDLLPTVRSRSLAIYLGAAASVDPGAVADLAESFGAQAQRYFDSGSAVFLLAAAAVLHAAESWEDVRSGRPWSTAAAAVKESADGRSSDERRRLLALAEALLQGSDLRMRAIAPERILEGLVSRHLASP